MSKPFVAILMGSENDLSIMEKAIEQLKLLNIPFEVNVLSAHRTPKETVAYIEEAETRGCAIFIAAAGMAAHLAGAVAANTIKPVIGVPIDSSLMGLDALLSTVQMPGGIPVACTAIGKAGAHNAAILAAEILALQDKHIAQQLLELRETKRQALQKANQQLKGKY
jgi:5-(carboxyamino)imidazole ribonucleotide mutase